MAARTENNEFNGWYLSVGNPDARVDKRDGESVYVRVDREFTNRSKWIIEKL